MVLKLSLAIDANILSCDQEFSQKVVACNHEHCNHLNIALACLYFSFDNTPRMHWYSASTWKHHTHKHIQDNLPIHRDNPAFFQQFSEVETIPSTSKLTPDLSQADVIQKGPKQPSNSWKRKVINQHFPPQKSIFLAHLQSLHAVLNKAP